MICFTAMDLQFSAYLKCCDMIFRSSFHSGMLTQVETDHFSLFSFISVNLFEARWVLVFGRKERPFDRDGTQELFFVRNKARLFCLAAAGFNRHSIRSVKWTDYMIQLETFAIAFHRIRGVTSTISGRNL